MIPGVSCHHHWGFVIKGNCLQTLVTDKACIQEVLLGWPELQSIFPEYSRVIQTCINCIHFKLCYPHSHDDHCPFIYQWALEKGCLHRCGHELPFSRIGVGSSWGTSQLQAGSQYPRQSPQKHCGKTTQWLKAPEARPWEPEFKSQHMFNKS